MSLIHWLHTLDQSLTLQINSIHCVWSDHLWQFFSAREVWFPMYLVIAVMLFIRLGWKRGLVAVLSIIATTAACDQFANLIKDSVCRLRPCYDPWMVEYGVRVLEGRGNLYGFFSAHAANTFGFAVCSSMAFMRDTRHRHWPYAAGITLWALLVSASRIFVGKHYLGDVLVGIMVGVLFGWVLGRIAGFCFNRERPRRRRRR